MADSKWNHHCQFMQLSVNYNWWFSLMHQQHQLQPCQLSPLAVSASLAVVHPERLRCVQQRNRASMLTVNRECISHFLSLSPSSFILAYAKGRESSLTFLSCTSLNVNSMPMSVNSVAIDFLKQAHAECAVLCVLIALISQITDQVKVLHYLFCVCAIGFN